MSIDKSKIEALIGDYRKSKSRRGGENIEPHPAIGEAEALLMSIQHQNEFLSGSQIFSIVMCFINHPLKERHPSAKVYFNILRLLREVKTNIAVVSDEAALAKCLKWLNDAKCLDEDIFEETIAYPDNLMKLFDNLSEMGKDQFVHKITQLRILQQAEQPADQQDQESASNEESLEDTDPEQQVAVERALQQAQQPDHRITQEPSETPDFDTMVAAVEHLRNGILMLRMNHPSDYKVILNEILLRALNDDDTARFAFIIQLVESLDPAHIAETLNKITSGDCGDLQKKSPFRESIERLLQRWGGWIEGKITVLTPDPTGWSERRIQVTTLKKALDKQLMDKNGLLYSDDQLVQAVDSIHEHGKLYFHGIFSFDVGFNNFLSELKEINERRHSEMLRSSEGYYYGQESLTNLLVVLNKILMDRAKAHLSDAIKESKKSWDASVKNVALNAENTKLKKLNAALQDRVAALTESNTSKLTDLVKTLMEKNVEGEREIQSLRESNDRLSKRLGDGLTSSEDEFQEEQALKQQKNLSFFSKFFQQQVARESAQQETRRQDRSPVSLNENLTSGENESHIDTRLDL